MLVLAIVLPATGWAGTPTPTPSASPTGPTGAAGPAGAADPAAPSPPRSPAPARLRLSGVPVVDHGQVRLVAVVPPVLAGRPVPPSAFTARQGEWTLPVRSTRLTDDGVDLVLVLDTGVAREDLLTEQAAAAELLQRLPDGVRPVVVDPASPRLPEAATGSRRQAAAALAALRAASDTSVPATLSWLLRRPPTAAWRQIVVLAVCRDVGRGAYEALRPQVGAAGPQLDAVQIGGRCGSELPGLARASGGQGITVADPTLVPAAVDATAAGLLGAYRLTFPVDATSPAPVEVRLDVADVHDRVAFTLARATGGAAGRTGGSGSAEPLVHAVAIALVAVALAAAVLSVLAGLLARRRRTSPAR